MNLLHAGEVENSWSRILFIDAKHTCNSWQGVLADHLLAGTIKSHEDKVIFEVGFGRERLETEVDTGIVIHVDHSDLTITGVGSSNLIVDLLTNILDISLVAIVKLIEDSFSDICHFTVLGQHDLERLIFLVLASLQVGVVSELRKFGILEFSLKVSIRCAQIINYQESNAEELVILIG